MLTLKHKWNNLKTDMGGLLNQRKNQKGFTLIEIVLVLAIAGLIFVVVFLAVQGAQRGRRDTERKSAAARLIAAAEQMASNSSSGAYPGGCTSPANFAPSNNSGAYNAGGTAAAPAYPCQDGGALDIDHVRYTKGVDCEGNSSPNRYVRAEIKLETGSTDYCLDNN